MAFPRSIVSDQIQELSLRELWTRGAFFPQLRFGCPPDDLGHQGPEGLTNELPDLNGNHLGRIHLLVEELDDPSQLVRNLVRDENHTNATGLEVRLDLAPEVRVVLPVAEETIELAGWVETLSVTPTLEYRASLLDGPPGHPIGGVIQHLPNNLTPEARIRAALDLHQGRHGITVEEEMVERPAATPSVLIGYRMLPRDQ